MKLLLHSMNEFRQIILTALEMADVKDVVEVGTEYGGMSTVLAEWLRPRGGSLCCIDPAPKPEFLNWVTSADNVRHIAKLSLEALPEVSCADAWLVDGDHNWYTVYNELGLIFKACKDAGKFPLIFLHDVGWPCGRRDMYYAPKQIPEEFRRSYTYDAGATPGVKMLTPRHGFRGGQDFAYADEEGGPRNGVLTAVEDAIADQKAEGQELALALIPAVFGLGVVFSPTAPWAGQVAAHLIPMHLNPLVETLEQNRLANYLTVLSIMDGNLQAGPSAARP